MKIIEKNSFAVTVKSITCEPEPFTTLLSLQI